MRHPNCKVPLTHLRFLKASTLRQRALQSEEKMPGAVAAAEQVSGVAVAAVATGSGGM